MVDPIRSRNRVAAVFLVSLAVFVPALVIPRSGDDLTVRKTILFASLAVMLISAVWLMVSWDLARRLIRLRAGEGIVGRWMIDPARWQWFRHHSNEWDKREGVRPNDADLAQNPGDAGIEVVVTLNAIRIGRDFWPLEKDARITVRADWIEFYDIIPKADGPPLRTVLRLPLEPGRESVGAEVQQAYQRAFHAPRSGLHPLIAITLLCFVGLPAVTALMVFIATLTGWIE